MTKDEIIALARAAGMEVHGRKGQIRIGSAVLTGCDSTDAVMRFAALVEAKKRDDEREACAKLVERLTERKRWIRGGINGEATKPCEYAAAIRARSNHVA